jgi:hypothetical protein
MRVVIVDDMLSMPDEDEQIDGTCDRCRAPLEEGTGAQATVWFVQFGQASWSWCDECADDFTAWRLVKAGPSAIDGPLPPSTEWPG